MASIGSRPAVSNLSSMRLVGGRAGRTPWRHQAPEDDMRYSESPPQYRNDATARLAATGISQRDRDRRRAPRRSAQRDDEAIHLETTDRAPRSDRDSHKATVIVGEPGGGPHGAATKRDGPNERRVAKVRKPGVGERGNGRTIDDRRHARAARGGAGGSQRCGRAERHVERPRNSKNSHGCNEGTSTGEAKEQRADRYCGMRVGPGGVRAAKKS